MMEILLFTLNAIVIYLLADWVVRTMETRRGEALKHRQAVFFGVFLVLVLLSFKVLRTLLA
jgi:surface polysaccharide O-acyltransferase-like enzyme